MKKVNVGLYSLLSNGNASLQTTANTGKYAMSNVQIKFVNENLPNVTLRDSSGARVENRFDEITEIWFSFDFIVSAGSTQPFFISFGDKLPMVKLTHNINSLTGAVRLNGNIIYMSETSYAIDDNGWANVEVHYRTGADGRVDVWVNHKLAFSYSHSTNFGTAAFNYARIHHETGSQCMVLSHFIVSDEGRIGFEKFYKLNIEPSTEQTIGVGGKAEYTISGLTAEELSGMEITGVGVCLQPTSKDADISKLSLRLNGHNLGTADVSASGNDYTFNYAATKSGDLKWIKDDIEGKIITVTAGE